MSFDLTGIENINEFYSHHYLSTILESDLKKLFANWKQQEEEKNIKTPHSQIIALCGKYFQSKSQFIQAKTPLEKLQIFREFFANFFYILGYTTHPALKELDNQLVIPILAEAKKENGKTDIWILETFNEEEFDSFESLILPQQFTQDDLLEKFNIPEENWANIISKKIFVLEEPPRWIILANMENILLIDRSKWGQKRWLHFNLDEIFGRKESSTIKAFCALLHRENISPTTGPCFLDTLDENSHKHAFAVSEDLKYGIRKAVELIGNEYIYYNRTATREAMYNKNLAQKLTRESLRYLYRMLFIFYVEARPELNFAPMKSEEYRKGYSLESLRELELIPLNDEKAKNGHYIHNSIQTLFKLIYEGFATTDPNDQANFTKENKPTFNTFRISALKSYLFDPKRTELLSKTKFRNSVLQEIICLLSLSKESKGKSRGRISYAQLGINQLGHVYEGLLSYTGFFAEEDLYQVKPAGSKIDDTVEQAYFVPGSELHKYNEKERVYQKNGNDLLLYPKGTFIYRLSGRDREKSASYYTPEVLTQCVVKYALKELLKDKKADDILILTICEPALGSGSFLNEALNQLAENYLNRKQKELGKIIDPEQYALEKQKVKSFIAANNLYGVDLNGMAIELAEVSIWLNTIYPGGPVPWFKMRFATGNSLIGTCSECFEAKDLTDKKWLEKVPTKVTLNAQRNDQQIYHFLLPDKGMAHYKNKVIKKLMPQELQKITEWRKEFIKPFSREEIITLQKLSSAIDKLWQKYIQMRLDTVERTKEQQNIWGQELVVEKENITIHKKDEHAFGLYQSFGPYQRLKLVMDYWCALWFWPIDKADLLPSRDRYLLDLNIILQGSQKQLAGEKQLELFSEKESKQLNFIEQFGFVDVGHLVKEVEHLEVVAQTTKRIRFFHWELEFADLFFQRDGFDLILGNPPWVKVEWNETGVLASFDPIIALHKFSSSKVANIRDSYLQNNLAVKKSYLEEFSEFSGTKTFMNGLQNYPLLKGVQTNLYKCFITRSWNIGNKDGCSTFLHPDGIYDDAKGKILRKEVYQKLKYHFQFINELNLFAEIDHHTKYSVNVYKTQNHSQNTSKHIFNLFHPQTIEECFNHSGIGEISGIKDKNFQWSLCGHKNRIIELNKDNLELINQIFEGEKDYQYARMVAIHSQEILSVLNKFSKQKRKLGDLQGEYYATVMFDETYAQRGGYIVKDISFPERIEDVVISGPHYYVGNPYNKMPREKCKNNLDYYDIDLTQITDNFIPRTLYKPTQKGHKQIPTWKNKRLNLFYRHINREMIGSGSKRTFIPAIIPVSTMHVHTTIGVAFQTLENVVKFNGLCSSLVYDFLIKIMGKEHANQSVLKILPFFNQNLQHIISRALRLNSITVYYKDLWGEIYRPEFKQDSFSKNDPRLRPFSEITSKWSRNCALRYPYERRQALVELDTLAALVLDLTLEELLTIYRIQFPVLQKYEADNHYDQNGYLVPKAVLKMAKKENIDTTKQGNAIKYQDPKLYPLMEREYKTPFDTCDREADMTQAYKFFQEKIKEQENVS